MNTEVIFYLLFLIVGFILGRVGVKTEVSDTNTTPVIKKPNLNPFEAYRNKEEKKEQERIEKEMKLNLENINNYNGSSEGQKDIV